MDNPPFDALFREFLHHEFTPYVDLVNGFEKDAADESS